MPAIRGNLIAGILFEKKEMDITMPSNLLGYKLDTVGFFRVAGVLSVMVPLSILSHKAHAMASLVLSGTVDLNFGAVTETGAGGTVILGISNNRSVTGAVSSVSFGSAAVSGLIQISGSTGLAIDMSMGASTFSVSNGTASMIVDSFNLNGGGSTIVFTMASNPSSLSLGGRLTVSGGQAAGTYTGEFTVNANYQ